MPLSDQPTPPSPQVGLSSGALPSVTVIVVNWNGKDYLDPCLQSLQALDYPSDRLQIIVVDNASHDGSIEHLRRHYSTVTVLPQTHNLGFSPAVNLAASSATTDAVALVNNDMRVDPQWLRHLAKWYRPEQGTVCVAGTMLNWDGDRIDYAGGAVNLHGFGEQPHHGQPLSEVVLVDGSTQPFACGGSMLVHRETFVSLGGFDPAFFAYFEDVDFGLRLQVCGLRTVLAAHAISYHRHHGTSSRFKWHERMVLLERNALRLLIKNVSDDNLAPLLAAAMLLQSQRALFDAHSPREEYDVGRGLDDLTAVNRLALSRLHATDDVLADLPALLELRQGINDRRLASDREVFATFRMPFAAMGNDDATYQDRFAQVAKLLQLDRLFDGAPVRSVLLLCHDLIGERMAGTAIRTWEMACALSQFAEVTVGCDREITRTHPGVSTFRLDDDGGVATLQNVANEADVVVLFGFDLVRYPFLAKTRALRVVDLYDPWIFGSLEQYDGMTTVQADQTKDHEIAALNGLLDAGDMFMCASERQRDFWLGMLASRGRIDKRAHDMDPQLRKLIDVVPFGVPPEPRKTQHSDQFGLRNGRYPSINAESLVLLWTGGTWDWFDPLVVVDSFAALLPEFPTARLFFMGLELEGRGIPAMSMTGRLVQRINDLNLIDSGAVVVGPWVPYDHRGAVLRDADIGMIAAKGLAENRLAFRTRMLDHFWAGLPTITTDGDVLAQVAAQAGAGIAVPPDNPRAMVEAMRTLLRDAERRQQCSAAALDLADRYRWTTVVRPLTDLLSDPSPYRASRQRRALP
jgi:GT2 family glycosyltransferase